MKYYRSCDHFDPKAFGKVAVLLGGNSAERQVSLTSGERVYTALNRQGVQCELIDTCKNVVEQLQAYEPDYAFIALHGWGGEDGTVQGLLEIMDIPYSGSGVMASALAMDKYRCKLLWQSIGLLTPKFTTVIGEIGYDHAESLLPALVKPSMEGSSVGMTRVDRSEDLMSACERASKHKGTVLIESFVDGAEFTVGILNGQALPVIRIEFEGDFYDYEAKYLSDETQYLIPCGLPPNKEYELKTVALTAFEALGCSGWGRVDFMQDRQGKFWLLEVNTIPGMTDHSLLPMAAANAGLYFDELVTEILKTADG